MLELITATENLKYEKPGFMSKNITCLFKNIENSACAFCLGRITQIWYFYLHKVQALLESRQTDEHIPAFMANGIMYKTGRSRLIELADGSSQRREAQQSFSWRTHHKGQRSLSSSELRFRGSLESMGNGVLSRKYCYFTFGIAGRCLLERRSD